MKKLLILLFALTSTLLYSQEKQPKIGLVLSGGGAKGFAHVGILKEIDKAGLQIDYIAGTSMGAVIGGLYAIGYSGNDIEQIILNTDFEAVLRDKLTRNTKPFFEKETGEKTVITLPVKKGKASLPRAVSKGQNILNLLTELFASVEGANDFAKLEIPFFCIATDVETGREVILEKGDLPLSIRASASFPTLLIPVEINDRLLVDGGIANNFPIALMREKGADVIIGVDVEGRLYEKEKLNSVVAIMGQIMSYQMYNKSNLQKKGADFYIHPKIYKYNVVDFNEKEKILEIGKAEGKKYSATFKELATLQTYKKPKKVQQKTIKQYLISDMNISGAKYYTRSFILGKLKIKYGDTISRKEITKRINLLSATKNYERIEYTLENIEGNAYALNLKLIESKDYASLKLGIHYDLLYQSGILANYNQKNLLRKNDLFSVDVILGDNIRYNLNYFVDNGFYISYGLTSRYNNFRASTKFNPIVSMFPNINSINLKYTDITNQLFIQTTFNRKFAIGLGVEHKFVNATTETIVSENVNDDEEFTFDNSNYLNAYGYIKLDTYDKKYFVTKGYFADLSFRWYLASSDFNNDFSKFAQTKGTLGFATTFFDKLTFQLTNEAGFTLEPPKSDVFDYYLGGYNQNYINTFVSFYGYDFAELSNNSFIKSEFNFRYRLAKNHYASFIANYARLEGNVFRNLDLFQNIKSGYALGYSFNSFIGPVELKYSWSPETQQQYWLFNLGFWF
ncbi:patatin-like phospholipase family protein [uncultured Polaribacter sp.]|uniref:patatin-like phospholipase family protein n=1 Tax=uncultured Polaribacter sp. TaxID=174711 RepID=UPI002615FD0D|nr:patatin-like phospholipase family protein [uncultured Polaribacter sp.]